jgi:hypothetical protein
LDLLAQLGVVNGAPKALVVGQGLVVDDQLAAVLVALALSPQDPDPIGSGRIDGVALLQQKGTRLQLRHRPKLHQDVGVERRVVKSLLLVAEARTEHLHQPTKGAAHGTQLQLGWTLLAGALKPQEPEAKRGHL